MSDSIKKNSLDEDFDILKEPVYEQLDYRTAELVKEIAGMEISDCINKVEHPEVASGQNCMKNNSRRNPL